MKKILSLILMLAMLMSLMLIATPAAYADGETADPAEAAAVQSATPIIPAAEPVVFSVEKHPTSETITAGGKAIFMSYPKGEKSYAVYWTFEDDKGNVTEAENAPDRFPGLIVELPDRQRIRLRNVPDSMNGLKVQAHFAKADGETIHSDYAYLWVEPNEAFAPQQFVGTQPTQPTAESPCVQQQPAVQPCPKIVITKHPIDEIYLRDGQSSTFFTSYASNYAWMTWEFKIGDYGDPFSAEIAARDYGLYLEGINSEKLWIRNITWGINGWYVRAVFYDCNGCPTYSNWAFMRLVECIAPKPCKPACPPPVCYDPCYDPYWTPCAVAVAPVCMVPETTVSYSHTEIDTVAVETTFPGVIYPGFYP